MAQTIDLTRVKDTIDAEGFDYAFRQYSTFDKVKDQQFHALRQAYINAADELESYVDDHSEESEDY